MPSDVWGLLLKEDALRDYRCGQEVQALGIKTNHMECVLELDYPIHIAKTNVDLKPVLLQYNVDCPYRISDAPFMTREQIIAEVNKWEKMNDKDFDKDYLLPPMCSSVTCALCTTMRYCTTLSMNRTTLGRWNCLTLSCVAHRTIPIPKPIMNGMFVIFIVVK